MVTPSSALVVAQTICDWVDPSRYWRDLAWVAVLRKYGFVVRFPLTSCAALCAVPRTSDYFADAFTMSHAADSAFLISPSFEVTAMTVFVSGMKTTSAYHMVFEPLCQNKVCGMREPGSFFTQPQA